MLWSIGNFFHYSKTLWGYNVELVVGACPILDSICNGGSVFAHRGIGGITCRQNVINI